eukprot:CAMPEP_0174235236 /NCGR_PEP_ID=MMETSP0417-20130205/4754_1 /TAXON_ID=242541 /ORGANISM="Mayorella sp, Strain BSH-02190019" /LENGTH=321 /DNA_ID=CAMNT_0015313717 /DNA_START=51 /DNA_END=1016 /DNA_ORIENTATION=-
MNVDDTSFRSPTGGSFAIFRGNKLGEDLLRSPLEDITNTPERRMAPTKHKQWNTPLGKENVDPNTRSGREMFRLRTCILCDSLMGEDLRQLYTKCTECAFESCSHCRAEWTSSRLHMDCQKHSGLPLEHEITAVGAASTAALTRSASQRETTSTKAGRTVCSGRATKRDDRQAGDGLAVDGLAAGAERTQRRSTSSGERTRPQRRTVSSSSSVRKPRSGRSASSQASAAVARAATSTRRNVPIPSRGAIPEASGATSSSTTSSRSTSTSSTAARITVTVTSSSSSTSSSAGDSSIFSRSSRHRPSAAAMRSRARTNLRSLR